MPRDALLRLGRLLGSLRRKTIAGRRLVADPAVLLCRTEPALVEGRGDRDASAPRAGRRLGSSCGRPSAPGQASAPWRVTLRQSGFSCVLLRCPQVIHGVIEPCGVRDDVERVRHVAADLGHRGARPDLFGGIDAGVVRSGSSRPPRACRRSCAGRPRVRRHAVRRRGRRRSPARFRCRGRFP